MQTYKSGSEQETIRTASDWVQSIVGLTEPVLVLLNGDYGVGKTQFAKGLALGLGVIDNVTSPSYTYMREYDFNHKGMEGKLVHVDAWRVKTIEELMQTGILNYLVPGNIVVVEWGHKAEGLSLPGGVNILEVNISETGADTREITINER